MKDVLVFLAAAGIIVPVFHRARIGAVLAFLVIGILEREGARLAQARKDAT